MTDGLVGWEAVVFILLVVVVNSADILSTALDCDLFTDGGLIGANDGSETCTTLVVDFASLVVRSLILVEESGIISFFAELATFGREVLVFWSLVDSCRVIWINRVDEKSLGGDLESSVVFPMILPLGSFKFNHARHGSERGELPSSLKGGFCGSEILLSSSEIGRAHV